MNPKLFADFAWLFQLEREEEGRRMRRSSTTQPSLRANIARRLVHAGIHIDRESVVSVMSSHDAANSTAS